MLVQCRPKVSNYVCVLKKWVITYVSSCCAGTVCLEYLNMNTQVFDYPSGNCTPGRLELRLVLSCYSLGSLLSLLC